MRRREFIKTITGAAAWPWAARAQQQSASQLHIIAILSSVSINKDEERAFRDRLAELGWQEGRNVRYEIRASQSDIEQSRRFAAELVAMHADVILADNSQMTQLVLERTRNIPVVFIAVPDPIGTGLVASFARPGGTATGFTNFEPSIGGKWLEFLKGAMPDLKHALVILHAKNPTASEYEKAIAASAPRFSVEVMPAVLSDGPGIDTAIAKFAHDGGGGLIVPSSALSVFNKDRIIALAAQYRLPAMYPYSEFATAGGLMSYGITRTTYYREAASYVARILKGEKPADLPVQAPNNFQLVINLTTAKALGLVIPASLLSLADELIE
jgi:ABC-type uncharacterized transport system substrate-binding protein